MQWPKEVLGSSCILVSMKLNVRELASLLHISGRSDLWNCLLLRHPGPSPTQLLSCQVFWRGQIFNFPAVLFCSVFSGSAEFDASNSIVYFGYKPQPLCNSWVHLGCSNEYCLISKCTEIHFCRAPHNSNIGWITFLYIWLYINCS